MLIPRTRWCFTQVLNCLILTGLAVFITASTRAQSISYTSSSSSISMMAPGSFRNLMRPDYSRRDLKLMFSGLNIDQSQRYVLEILMDEYTNKFSALVEEFKGVRDRYEWPHTSPFGQIPGNLFTEDILNNLDNAQVIELDGDGIQFVGVTTATIDIEAGGDHTGVFISDDPDANSEAGATVHTMVMVATTDTENGEDALHTIPPEVLEKLKESLRKRLEDLLANQKTQLEESEVKQEEEDKESVDKEKASADEVAQAAEKLRDEKAQLAQSFQSDLKLLLSESQTEALPATDRTLRRINTIPYGEFAGEKLDLVRFTANYPGSPSSNQELDSALGQYKQQLDIALKDRNQYLSESEIKNFVAYAQEDNDEILKLMQRESDLRVAVRTVNENYLQNVASLLPEERAADFQAKARKQAYKTVYRATTTQQLFDNASKIENLDQTMTEAIETLKQRYLQELAIANERLAEAVRTEQPRQKQQMTEMMAKIRANDDKFIHPPSNPMQEGFQGRHELGKRYTDQLKQILSDEQFQSISPRQTFFESIRKRDPKK